MFLAAGVAEMEKTPACSKARMPFQCVKKQAGSMVPRMADPVTSAIVFVVGLAISTVVIFITTKLFGQKEGIGRAFVTAIIGAVIYSITYFIFGNGWIAAIVGGFVWLIALRGLYDIGWLRALAIAVIVWIAATIVGLLLPTVPGPL